MAARLGYPKARFRIEIVPRDEEPVADLVVNVEEEGPPATIDEFEITGEYSASEDAILKFLALRPGVLWTAAERARIEQLLWDSGRFLSYDIQLCSANFTVRWSG